ncbi:ketopantoate reductase C-terminal domain-containing protein [Pigmentiphaga sp.]|uniref:ketopantoate reductase family protein n=1 Tax=Pigmentiphaga sp. TaxID=1977564 RepID=UPI0025CDBE37|nr:ketopantoate reductase C-terminal domain-containing protein [Pigmentiphaga sp.]
MENIVVVGAGAIGTWLAAMLSLSTSEHCSLKVRPNSEKPDTWTETVTMESGGAARAVPVRVTQGTAALHAADHIILCMKEADVDAFLIENQALLETTNAGLAFMSSRFPDWKYGASAPLPADRLRRTLYETGRMHGFACWVGASASRPFHVRQDGARGELFVGSLSGDGAPRSRSLHDRLTEHGIPARWRPDILADMWVKAANSFVWNSAALLTRWDNGRIGQDPDLSGLVLQSLEETDALALALDIHVRTPAAKRFAATASAAHHKMSMLQDLERGKTTEYAQLLASFMNCRRYAGSETPVATTLARLCGAISRSH